MLIVKNHDKYQDIVKQSNDEKKCIPGNIYEFPNDGKLLYMGKGKSGNEHLFKYITAKYIFIDVDKLKKSVKEYCDIKELKSIREVFYVLAENNEDLNTFIKSFYEPLNPIKDLGQCCFYDKNDSLIKILLENYLSDKYCEKTNFSLVSYDIE